MKNYEFYKFNRFLWKNASEHLKFYYKLTYQTYHKEMKFSTKSIISKLLKSGANERIIKEFNIIAHKYILRVKIYKINTRKVDNMWINSKKI